MTSALQRIKGHLWTVGPVAQYTLRPPSVPGTKPFAAHITDERGEPITLTGQLHEVDGELDDTLVILVHGLGGSADSFYMLDAQRECAQRGWSTLRLSLRGVESTTQDIYHAGLTHDLHQLLADEQLSCWRRIFIAGYSLGGHMTMRLTTDGVDERVRAACALCAPVDLASVIHHIDAPRAVLYREYVLRSLKAHHDELIAHGKGIAPRFRVQRLHRLREFDALVIAPRFGFDSPEHYYQSVGVANVIEQVSIPLLYIGSTPDPMIPTSSSVDVLDRAPRGLVDVRWVEQGGHVYFPPAQDLGFGQDLGVIPQMLSWFERYL